MVNGSNRPGAAVQASGLGRAYVDRELPGGRIALSGVDLVVAYGEFVSLVGPSGSGKTTLLNVIGGLDRKYSGSLSVLGRDMAGLPDRELSRMRGSGIGFVFQAFNLLSHLTILENVLLPASFAPGRPDSSAGVARNCLDRVGLADRSASFPWQLSAGERQRVAIARALLNGPRLLLCDEPTGNLDERTGSSIISIFRQLNVEEGMTLIVATHEDRMAAASGRCVRLEGGRLV